MPRDTAAPTESLFAGRDFPLLWAVGGVSNVVRWLEVLTASLFAFDLTHSALTVAVVSAARAAPLIVMGAFTGVLADAVDRKRILIGGMLLTAAGSACVCALSWAGMLAAWHLVVAGLIGGLVYGTEMPARKRMVGESVPQAVASRAVALDSVTVSISRVVGPLLGGAAYEWIGVTTAFAVTTLLSLLAALLAAGVARANVARPLVLAGVIAELAEGVRLMRGTPTLLALLGVTLTMNLFGFAYTSLIAPIGADVFRLSPSLVGVLAAAEPAGASLGGLLLAIVTVAPKRDPLWLMLSSVVLFMTMMVLMPLAPGLWSASALMLTGGVGIALYTNLQTMISLTETPFALRSRVMGLITVAIGTWPLGQLLVGWLGDRIGPLWALRAMGFAGLALLTIVGRGYARRGRSR